eukprot:scaffold1687_cov405-Prasinococcus_capsulatus_cf.AAC.26
MPAAKSACIIGARRKGLEWHAKLDRNATTQRTWGACGHPCLAAVTTPSFFLDGCSQQAH